MNPFRRGAVVLVVFATFAIFQAQARADEGHTYDGEGAFSASFYLIGGQYNLNVNAKLTFTNINRNQPCTFGGHFSRLLPSQDTMTMGPIQVSTPIAYRVDKVITLPPGYYRVFIAPPTDCRWHFAVVSTAENSAGIAGVQVVKITGGRAEPAATASLNDKVEFSADIRTDHNAAVSASGIIHIIHDGQIVLNSPLQIGAGTANRGQIFFTDVQFKPGDARYLGRNTIKFVVKIGGQEFSSTADLTLTQ